MPIQSWCTGDFLNWTAAARAAAASCFRERPCCTWPQSSALLKPHTLLLDRGADVNARATVDDAGVGGQTAIFHAVTQFGMRAYRWRNCWWSAAPTSACV